MEAVVLRDIGPGEGIKPNGYSLLSLPRLHLVSRRRTAVKAVWPCETSLYHDIVLPTVARSIERSTVSRAIVLTTDHLSDESGMLARDQLPDQ